MRLRREDRATIPAPRRPGSADAGIEAPAFGAPVRPSDLNVHPNGIRVGELVVRARLATVQQVAAALHQAQQGPPRRVGQVLVEQGSLSERDLARVIAWQHSLDVVDLRETTPQQEAVALLPETEARTLAAVPLVLEGDILVVAVAVPAPDLVARLRQVTGRQLRIVVSAESDITRAIGNTYRALSGIGDQVKMFEAHDARRGAAARVDPAQVEDDAPVVRVVQLIITQALRDRASDIHIEPQNDRVRVRYRVDGALHDVLELPGSMAPVVVSRVKIMADMNIVERRRPQDGQISMAVEGRPVDIRVSTSAVIAGEKVVLRLLDKSRPLYELGQLGMREEMRERYATLVHAPYGMVICAGPTGSGKTTTLYGSLRELNRPERNIMTIEDPVEYTFPMINQIQINEAAGVTFADGLRSILRQDPDVILVGEIRDVDTARIAVQAALTGHFVLSSLHATDAASALHRLLDMGIEHFLVASSVTAVLAQRLMRRVCNHCRERHPASAEDLALLEAIGGKPPADGLVRGVGCNFCAHTGYLERIGVYEMLPVTEAIRETVLRRAPLSEIRSVARREGMHTLREEAARLVEGGITDLPEVLRSIYLPGS